MKIIFSYLSLTRGPRNSGTTIAVSTYSAQILVSKYHTLIKGITVLREMAGSLLKGKAEDESSIMLYQKRRKCSKKKKKTRKDEGCHRHRSSSGRVPNGQNWTI